VLKSGASGYRCLNYSDPFGLCRNPLAGGLGSLQCALEDTWAGIKSIPSQIADFAGDSRKGGFVASLAMVPLTIGQPAQQPIRLTAKSVVHVLERHIALGEKSAGKSIFNAVEGIVDLVRGADNVAPVTQTNRNLRRVVNAGRDIGLDRATGQQTSTYTVITNKLNELVTMFPGTSP
jgi:hypothetical protein